MTARLPLLLAALCVPLAACGGGDTATNSSVMILTDPVPVPDYVTAALADPARTMHVQADTRRKADEFMGRIDPAQLNRAVFAMLKPGGTWFIVDHAAAAGAGMRDTESLHRIDPAEVRRQIEAAGFQFAGTSRVLANSADDHTLPVFNPAVRGRTDQFILRFR